MPIEVSIADVDSADPIDLPVVALGGGPFGAFPMPPRRFAEAVAAVRALGGER